MTICVKGFFFPYTFSAPKKLLLVRRFQTLQRLTKGAKRDFLVNMIATFEQKYISYDHSRGTHCPRFDQK